MTYRFVDCRWELGRPGRGRELYRAGHVPGAAFLDVDADLSAAPGPGGRHPLPRADDFAAAAGRAGIGPGTFVVAYGNMGGAERLWWLLRHFGHDACAVLDGGIDAWLGPLRTGDEEIEPAVFEPRPRTDDTIDPDDLAAQRDDLVVVDARLPERWRGEPNPIDQAAGPHPRCAQRALARPAPRASGRRPRRLLRLRRHRLRHPAPALAPGPQRPPVPGRLERVVAARPPARPG